MEVVNETIERELSFKDLFFQILYGWRKLLLVAMIFALLLGGYKYISGNSILSDKQTLANQEASYQNALSAYNLSKSSLQKEVKNLEDSLERQNYYNENSVRMQINPFDKQVANISYYIDTDYKIMPEYTYQNADISKMVVRAYISLAQDGDLYNYIMDNLSYDIERRYLREIITVTAEYDTNMIFVQVVHSDNKLCEEIFEIIKDYFNQSQQNITDVVGEHEISIVDESLQAVVDFDLEAAQELNRQAAKNYENSLKEKNAQLNALIPPVKFVTSRSTVMKSAIKYAVVGFMLGIFIVSFFIMLTNILSDKLFDTRKIRIHHNLKLLGAIQKNSKKRLFGFIDRLISRLEGNADIKLSDSENIKVVSANLKAMLDISNILNGTVVITGTTDINHIDAICNDLTKEFKNSSYDFVSGANINYTAETITRIENCDAVVIVEERGRSTYKEITNELENIHSLHKKIIGFVII